MIAINYSTPDFRIRTEAGKDFIFDSIRKRWIVLSEEEWVRQNFIRYLVQGMHYPEAFIALEKEIRLGELTKRFDILIYNSFHQPWMLVECKAPGIELDEKVFQQVLRYHLALPCTYLAITNGQYTFGWEKKENSLIALHQLPAWEANK